jgi:hypothetical protein
MHPTAVVLVIFLSARRWSELKVIKYMVSHT